MVELRQQLQQMRAEQEQHSNEMQALQAQLACQLAPSIQGQAPDFTARGAAGVLARADVDQDWNQAGAEPSAKSLGKGPSSAPSIIRSASLMYCCWLRLTTYLLMACFWKILSLVITTVDDLRTTARPWQTEG